MSGKMVSRKIRTAEDHDRLRAALVPVDSAFWLSEEKWGVGRLERLVSQPTLEAYRRGWDLYRAALDDGDGVAVGEIGPRMIAALAFMDSEASGSGHKPLAAETWETAMGDGTVLVVCRTEAEATAVLRVSKASGNGRFSGAPSMGQTSEPLSTETALPVDLAVTVREQHEGRRLEVWTLAALARLVRAHGSVARQVDVAQPVVGGVTWEGSEAYSGQQMEEGAAADLVRHGYPLSQPLAF
jgi:hypothetical protein